MESNSKLNDVRQIIYSSYVNSDISRSLITSTEGFMDRKPTMDFLINKFFPQDKNAKILDIGCGHGLLAFFAGKHGYKNFMGFDISDEQIELGRKLGIDNIFRKDIEEGLKEVEDESLDMIICFDVIEHFDRSELLMFGKLISQKLKKGGKWLAHAPNACSPFSGSIRYGDLTHEMAFTISCLNQLKTVSNFQDVRFHECRPLVYNLSSLLRYVFWTAYITLARLAFISETADVPQAKILTRNFYSIFIR